MLNFLMDRFFWIAQQVQIVVELYKLKVFMVLTASLITHASMRAQVRT